MTLVKGYNDTCQRVQWHFSKGTMTLVKGYNDTFQRVHWHFSKGTMTLFKGYDDTFQRVRWQFSKGTMKFQVATKRSDGHMQCSICQILSPSAEQFRRRRTWRTDATNPPRLNFLYLAPNKNRNCTVSSIQHAVRTPRHTTLLCTDTFRPLYVSLPRSTAMCVTKFLCVSLEYKLASWQQVQN